MNKNKAVSFINDIKPSDTVIHLSHIDLDGYGASYMIKKHLNCVLIQGNTNYGEIISKLEEMQVSDSVKVIITDLNLTLDECKWLNDITTNWIVIDHHVTGNDSFMMYNNNYYLDLEICATLSTFNILHESNFTSTANNLKEIAMLVDTYDLWRKEKDLVFKQGMLMTHYVRSMMFEFNNLRLNYTEWLFDEIAPFLLKHGVQETEIQYNRLFRFWMSNLEGGDYLRDTLLPSNIKAAIMHVDGIKNYIQHSGDGYYIFSELSSKVTQYAFDELFKESTFKDSVLINLNSKDGTCSFRSVNNKAKDMAVICGGGGHPNAGGCKLADNGENITFLEQLISLLDK